ncbi:hypothetical protein V5K00_RS23455 [Enterobacter asburiae]
MNTVTGENDSKFYQRCDLCNSAGGIITKKADEITGFAYKPMLVGEVFLSKAGIMQNVTWYELE